MNERICIIGVYFGKFPNYFPLWMKSARYNSTIDFLIFTDQTYENIENIQFKRLSLDELQQKATHLLGFDAVLEYPYKCCDYKPLYGQLFSEYLQDYDYWGHCDFDMLFGNLRYFFNKYGLGTFDKFLVLGHLSLYRNTDEVNARYSCQGSKNDYRTVFTSNENFAFDELPGMGNIYHYNNFSLFDKYIFADISMIHYRFCRARDINLNRTVQNPKFQAFYWNNGSVLKAYYDSHTKKILTEEYIYIHFKKRPNFTVPFDPDVCNNFYITSSGFIPIYSDISRASIRSVNPYPGKAFEQVESIVYHLKRYKKTITRRITRIIKCN